MYGTGGKCPGGGGGGVVSALEPQVTSTVTTNTPKSFADVTCLIL